MEFNIKHVESRNALLRLHMDDGTSFVDVPEAARPCLTSHVHIAVGDLETTKSSTTPPHITLQGPVVLTDAHSCVVSASGLIRLPKQSALSAMYTSPHENRMLRIDLTMR